MTTVFSQSPAAVVMVRPRHFHVNPETESDNGFQVKAASPCPEIARAAACEVDHLAAQLESIGVRVHLFDEPRSDCPDAVFPNNWLSTHPTGQVVIYPMCAVSRRRERRADIVDHLKRHYHVEVLLDYSAWELEGAFLEGTGAMVIDHAAGDAYLCLSQRADARLFDKVCAALSLTPRAFEAWDATGRRVYHTNVMMSLAERFCLLGAELIRDPVMRGAILRRIAQGPRDIVELSTEQISRFAGNAIELSATGRTVLVISASAYQTLSRSQKRTIERHSELMPVAAPTVELAGGSVRCMLAGVHLAPRREPLPAAEPARSDQAPAVAAPRLARPNRP